MNGFLSLLRCFVVAGTVPHTVAVEAKPELQSSTHDKIIILACKFCHTHTHTHLMALCPGLPGTRKVKPIWILLKQETVSGSGISWAICKSASRSRQITIQHPTTQFFTGRMPFLPPNQQRQSTEGKM